MLIEQVASAPDSIDAANGNRIFDHGKAPTPALLSALFQNAPPAVHAFPRSLVKPVFTTLTHHRDHALHTEFRRFLDHPLKVIELDERGVQFNLHGGRWLLRQFLQHSKDDFVLARQLYFG